MLGFRFSERFTGQFYRLTAPLEPTEAVLDIEIVCFDILDFLRTRTAVLRGTFSVANFAASQHVEGEVRLRFATEGNAGYSFWFLGNDGMRYRLLGEKDAHVSRGTASFTELPMSVFDDRGRELGRIEFAFPFREEGARVLKSIRILAPGLFGGLLSER
jgi:hypothetical protein